jgi:SSS family solute:Na+ symporter
VLLVDVYLRLRGTSSSGSIAQSRGVTLALGLVMTVASCVMHDVITALTVAYDLLVGGLLVPIIGAMIWPRGTTAGALASIALGSALVVLFLVLDGLDSDLPIYFGLAGSLIAYVAVSLWLGPRPSVIRGANE